MANDEFRDQQQENRKHGLKARHETRVERAIREHLDSCIWIDPGRQTGQPCFGGTRIPVDPFMAIVEEAGAEAAKAFWPTVTDAHITAGRLWRERYSTRKVGQDIAQAIAAHRGEFDPEGPVATELHVAEEIARDHS